MVLAFDGRQGGWTSSTMRPPGERTTERLCLPWRNLTIENVASQLTDVSRDGLSRSVLPHRFSPARTAEVGDDADQHPMHAGTVERDAFRLGIGSGRRFTTTSSSRCIH